MLLIMAEPVVLKTPQKCFYSHFKYIHKTQMEDDTESLVI